MMKDKLQRGKVEIVFDLFRNGPGQWDIQLNTAAARRGHDSAWRRSRKNTAAA